MQRHTELQISEVQKFFYIKILNFWELRKKNFGSGLSNNHISIPAKPGSWSWTQSSGRLILCRTVSAISVLAITSDDVYQASPARPLPHWITFSRPLPSRKVKLNYSAHSYREKNGFQCFGCFLLQARGINFYNVPTGMIQVGDSPRLPLGAYQPLRQQVCCLVVIPTLYDAWSSGGRSGVSPGSSFEMWICSIR